MDLDKIKHNLSTNLDPQRYEHTIGVTYTAASLCMQHSIDVNQGMLAGLLHDCAKRYKQKEQYMLCKKYHIELNDVEQCNGALIHAKLGAYLAEKEFRIKNQEIISAILFHTTGRPEMSTLEKIIYIADYIEPHRKLPHIDDMRTLAFKDLDKTMYSLLLMSLEHLSEKKLPIDSMTIKTFNYYKEYTK